MCGGQAVLLQLTCSRGLRFTCRLSSVDSLIVVWTDGVSRQRHCRLVMRFLVLICTDVARIHSEPNRLGRSPGTDLSSPSVRLFLYPRQLAGIFVLPSFRFQYFLAVCDLFLISFPCSGRCCPLELLFSSVIVFCLLASGDLLVLHVPAPPDVFVRRSCFLGTSCTDHVLFVPPSAVLAPCCARRLFGGTRQTAPYRPYLRHPPFCATGVQDWSGCRGGSPLVMLMPGLRCCLPICLPASRGACYCLSMSCLSAPIGPVLVAADARPRRWSAGRRR